MEHKSIKLISLNAWAGRSLHPLMQFFKKYESEVDIFCLQEIHNTTQEAVDERHPGEHLCGSLFEKISSQLKDFEGTFACFDDEPRRMSLALFIRRGLPVKTVKDFVAFTPAELVETGSRMFTPRKLQYATLDFSGREFLVANYHGLWNAGPKTDTPERIEQANVIKSFLDTFNGSKILCGDFNLLPETQSMEILERGMRNLVKEHKVSSTRTQLYRHYDNAAEPNFADYILVTPDIQIVDFKVLPDIASDHAPLFLEFLTAK